MILKMKRSTNHVTNISIVKSNYISILSYKCICLKSSIFIWYDLWHHAIFQFIVVSDLSESWSTRSTSRQFLHRLHVFVVLSFVSEISLTESESDDTWSRYCRHSHVSIICIDQHVTIFRYDWRDKWHVLHDHRLLRFNAYYMFCEKKRWTSMYPYDDTSYCCHVFVVITYSQVIFFQFSKDANVKLMKMQICQRDLQ